MKQKTKEQSKDEDEKLKPRESIMKIIMKYSPIKRDDLIEETSKLKIKPNLLHFHLEKLLADKIITRQKNPFSYSLSKDSIFHDWPQNKTQNHGRARPTTAFHEIPDQSEQE